MGRVQNDDMLALLRDTVTATVRGAGPDLSARQLAVFLICYLRDGAHTVRGLAQALNVSKPAITRALDRLGEFDLARRKIDPLDRRSVLVQRTMRGADFLNDLRRIMEEASLAQSEGAAQDGSKFSSGSSDTASVTQFHRRQVG